MGNPRNWLGGCAAGVALTAAACSPNAPKPAKSAETLAVESKAGDFMEYYAQVLRLAQEHSAHPDSFRVAIDALPGSHLDEASWDAWVLPWREDPRHFADRLEAVIAETKPRPVSKNRP